MRETQLFFPGDTVYLRASALLGFLESIIVNDARMEPSGRFTYGIRFEKNPPSTQTQGGFNDHRRFVEVRYSTNELMIFCDAIDLVIQNLQLKLNRAVAQRDAQCNGGSDGSA